MFDNVFGWLHPKPRVLTTEQCQRITSLLSESEGTSLDFKCCAHDSVYEYLTRSADGKTCWQMHVKDHDLIVTDVLVKLPSSDLYTNIFYGLESSCKDYGVTRIIVQNTHDYTLLMYLLRSGYSLGLSGNDYRKLI